MEADEKRAPKTSEHGHSCHMTACVFMQYIILELTPVTHDRNIGMFRNVIVDDVMAELKPLATDEGIYSYIF